MEALEGWLCRCRKQQARVSRVSWATYVYDGGGEEVRENIPRNYTRHLPKETVRGLAGWGGPVYGIVCRCVSPTLGAKQKPRERMESQLTPGFPGWTRGLCAWT